jgi:hypothetical protein
MQEKTFRNTEDGLSHYVLMKNKHGQFVQFMTIV